MVKLFQHERPHKTNLKMSVSTNFWSHKEHHVSTQGLKYINVCQAYWKLCVWKLSFCPTAVHRAARVEWMEIFNYRMVPQLIPNMDDQDMWAVLMGNSDYGDIRALLTQYPEYGISSMKRALFEYSITSSTKGGISYVKPEWRNELYYAASITKTVCVEQRVKHFEGIRAVPWLPNNISK